MMRESKIISAAVSADMANPDFDSSGCKILIVRLSPFRDIEVSYAHLVLFDEARRAVPDAFIDFAFLPPEQDRRTLTAAGLPWFYGRASGKAPSKFDLILISCAFTLELVNLPWLLAQSGIPFLRAERLRRKDVPFLILGGSSAVTAGALLRVDDGDRVVNSLVDGIFFGEGEDSIFEIARTVAESTARRISKEETLDSIAAGTPGFWPCDAEHRAVRALAANRPSVLTSPLVLNGENADHTKLAITAGCVGYCAFCLEGWDRRPFREKELSDISSSAHTLKKSTGATDVELFSYNFNMHHSVENIIPALGRYFMRVSLMSQRLDVLAQSPTLLNAEIAAGKRSFTLGIEGISERMRRYFHKRITLDEVQKSASDIVAHGARELKLFYIISGFEEKEDFAEFKEFIEVLSSIKKNVRAHTRIIVSAGFLVRLPFTPLQFAPLAADKVRLSNISRQLEDSCLSTDMEYRLAAAFDDYWADQLLSLAGPAANRWILTCPDRGYVYDMRMSRGSTEALEAHLKTSSDFSKLLEEKPSSYRPHFAFIENEDHWKLVRSHYENSREVLTGTAQHALSTLRSKLKSKAPAETSVRAISAITAQEAAKARFEPVFVRVIEGEMMVHSTPEYERTWLIRSLSALVPNAERALFDCRLVLPDERWSATFSKLPGQTRDQIGFRGEKYFSLYGPDSAVVTSIIARAATALKSLCAFTLPLPHELPGSIAGLRGIECAQEPLNTEYCTLIYTTSISNEQILRNLIENWLKESNLHFTLKNDENRHDLTISPDSKHKKSVQSIQYYTTLSEISIKMRIGQKTDLRNLSEELRTTLVTDDIVFSIDNWG